MKFDIAAIVSWRRWIQPPATRAAIAAARLLQRNWIGGSHFGDALHEAALPMLCL
jgi:hypothetical protein